MGKSIDKNGNLQKDIAMESAQDAPQKHSPWANRSMDMPTASIASGFCQSLPKKGKASPWGIDEVKVKAWLAATNTKVGKLCIFAYVHMPRDLDLQQP